MKHIFLLATIAVVTAKLSFTHFHGRSYQGNILLHQNLAPISQNYDSENGAKQINITEENLSQSCILCQLLRKKTLASVSKCFKKIFFDHYLPYICWLDVIYLTLLVFLKSPWWLAWIFCAPTTLTWKIKLRK